ncbi:hypothetical protein QBC40DRAFT_204748 [Triangularia verruculosa]|uniref:DUF6594 domain-containing protein n=1 Tax=Triangularia verruculosa TaxID=2587418 RepID=A0AAN6XDJ0_9PEZI|nr:hypothetical protein QBC40DRAFT_204748 [Triangularia verruculosa]
MELRNNGRAIDCSRNRTSILMDLEHGAHTGDPPHNVSPDAGYPRRSWSILKGFAARHFPSGKWRSRPNSEIPVKGDKPVFNIEDLPNGYPRFSALMAAHESFLVTRRFSNLRTRLLLWEQDRVVELEAKLNKIDKDETCTLYLGNRRRDKNHQRLAVMMELKDALKSYDDIVTRTMRVNGLQPAYPNDVTSLQNWHAANGSITRLEMGFLNRREDLMSLSSTSNNDALPLWVERGVTEKVLSCLGVRRSGVSRDPLVHIYPREATSLLGRAILTSIIILLVLIPVIICYRVTNPGARLAIVVTTTAIFLFILSLSTKGKMLELVVAGATYSTVLIVFITGPGAQ